MTRKRSRSRHADSREFFNETHEPNTPPQSNKARSKHSSSKPPHQHHQKQAEPQQLTIDQRLAAKRKRIQIHPKNLSQEQYLLELNNTRKQIVFAIGPAGTGKAQPLTANIKIPGGWTTMGDIKIGDLVSTPSGNPASVTGIFPQGIKQTFTVTLCDGRSTKCCAEHLWEVFIDNKSSVINTIELIKLCEESSPYLRLPMHEIMDDIELPIDPLQLGTMLVNDVKPVPSEYLNASRNQKLKLLQGMLDTSIHEVDSGNLVFTASDALQNSVVYLVRSIGGSAKVKENGVHIRFSIREQDLELINVLSVIPDEETECQCIMVESDDHLYITDDFVVTHNTMLAVQWAVDQLKLGKVEKIIVTRPAVSVDESHGFLPGSLVEKMLPWTVGIFDVFHDNWSKAEVEHYIEEGVIDISPLAYMRGRTFHDACIIADEAQLCTENQMKMLLTRIGNGSKMVVTGDLAQADRGDKNGLKVFMDMYHKAQTNPAESRISMVRFTRDDIERHPVVAEVLKYYGEE